MKKFANRKNDVDKVLYKEYNVRKQEGGKQMWEKTTIEEVKSMGTMTEREKKILRTFALLMPKLSDSDKSYLIGLGEGMAMRTGREPERSGRAPMKELAG